MLPCAGIQNVYYTSLIRPEKARKSGDQIISRTSEVGAVLSKIYTRGFTDAHTETEGINPKRQRLSLGCICGPPLHHHQATQNRRPGRQPATSEREKKPKVTTCFVLPLQSCFFHSIPPLMVELWVTLVQCMQLDCIFAVLSSAIAPKQVGGQLQQTTHI